MSYIFEVFYRRPADPAKDSEIAGRVEAMGGRLEYREVPDALRRQGEHVEGPVEYGPG